MRLGTRYVSCDVVFTELECIAVLYSMEIALCEFGLSLALCTGVSVEDGFDVMLWWNHLEICVG